MKELTGQFVLENSEGQVVRALRWQSDSAVVIYRHDLKRVEVVSSVEELESSNVSFTVLKKVSQSGIRKRAVSLSNGAKLRYLDEVENTVSLVSLKEDSEEEEKKIYKWTALTQLGSMLVILLIALVIEPFLVSQPEEIIVTIPPKQVREMVKAQTVKMSEKPVQKQVKYAKKKVVSPVKQMKRQTLTAKVTSKRKADAPLRTKVQVEKSGALGVLGGMKSGSKNSAGFNVSAKNDSSGSSWDKVGQGGRGGMERAIRGKGLVAGVAGNGGKVSGGGGYGTRGSAGGGRPGYGQMNIGGSAGSYFQALEEEALVEGGLDRDQIAAVINKHLGEIRYCYEKGLQKSPSLKGRVGVDFTINGRGQVSTARAGSSSLKSASVEGCIVNRLKGWAFPKPIGGVNVKVSYPFILTRAG